MFNKVRANFFYKERTDEDPFTLSYEVLFNVKDILIERGLAIKIHEKTNLPDIVNDNLSIFRPTSIENRNETFSSIHRFSNSTESNTSWPNPKLPKTTEEFFGFITHIDHLGMNYRHFDIPTLDSNILAN